MDHNENMIELLKSEWNILVVKGDTTGKRNLKPIAMPDGDVTTLYLRYEFISDEIKELYDVVSMPFIQCFELSKASGDV